MANIQITIFFLIMGILLVIGEGIVVDETLELNGHRSGIYVSQEDGSEQGIVHMFENITDVIGAYGLFHYNQNFAVAASVKDMLEHAIRSKVRESDAHDDIDWKTFLKREFRNIEESLLKEDKNQLIISMVIVDQNMVTQAQLIPDVPLIIIMHNKVWYSNSRFVIMEDGFRLDHNEIFLAQKVLQDRKIWKGAAKMIFDMVKITDENKNEAKGTIVIEPDMPMKTNQISFVDDILKLDRHRSGIYLSQKVGSDQGLVHLFEKINEQIGAYGLIHYKHNYNDAISIKAMLVNAIRWNVPKNSANTNIKWNSFLKTELFNIRQIIKDEKLTIAIVIVDGINVTQIESISMEPFENVNIQKEIVIHSSSKRFIIMEAGLQFGAVEKANAIKSLKAVMDWKEAAKTVIDSAKITENNQNKSKGAIIIELDISKIDHLKRFFVCGKQ